MVSTHTKSTQAHYYFQQYLFGRLEKYVVKVEILDQTTKRYKVKLLAPNVNGHRWGDVIWVNKSSVSIPPPAEDYSNEWWNK